jgi:hypothetical protein
MSDKIRVVEDEEVAPERQWPFVLTLKRPIDFADERIAKLEFREGCLGDLKSIKVTREGITIDQLMLIASRMCGQPVKVIEMLGEVMTIALDFYGKCLGAGKKL